MFNGLSLKNTKIVATIGPVADNKKTMTELIKNGMNVARLNFSHGDFNEHDTRLKLIKSVSKELGKPVAILQDLAGPKIRIGDFYKEKVALKSGSIFTLTEKKITGDEKEVFVNYKNLSKEVKRGNTVLLDDGKINLKVLSSSNGKIKCRVVEGGVVKGRRGVNIPGAFLKISSITAKDKKDLMFGLQHNVDFFALSFVRKAKDINDLRKILKQAGSDAWIIAKIETEEAIKNIDEIIEATDAVMVARGDLAVEVSVQEVPLLQKEIIKKCNYAGKPVITATQMLESMISLPVPTRAEVSDVANAIFDGTDAVMLSEETTLGKYPANAVKMMSSIAIRVENGKMANVVNSNLGGGTAGAIGASVAKVSNEVNAKAIFVLTESGFTARAISRFRAKQPIVAMTPNSRTFAKLTLIFGCRPVLVKKIKHIAEAAEIAGEIAQKNGIAKKGEKIVLAAGVPFGKSGSTNLLLVHTV